MKFELDKGLELNLTGDSFGIENLRPVARYATRIFANVEEAAEDGKLSVIEGIGLFRLTRQLIKKKRHINWRAVKNEFLDLNKAEWTDIAIAMNDEYHTASQEAELVADARELILTFLDSVISFDKFRNLKNLRSIA